MPAEVGVVVVEAQQSQQGQDGRGVAEVEGAAVLSTHVLTV